MKPSGFLPIHRLLVMSAMITILLLSGCATYTQKSAALRERYNSADFVAAEVMAEDGIAAETGVAKELVHSTNALDPAINPQKGDALLYLLDKGMTRFVEGDAETAVKVFRKARNAFDANLLLNSGEFLKDVSSMFVDDSTRAYHGADYEHITLRAMLAMSDLVTRGGDAYAYAVQLGKKQEEIIGSSFGDISNNGSKSGYRPREHYSRVALGAYLQGVIREEALDRDEAATAYKRAITFSGNKTGLYANALKRVQGKHRIKGGHGSLHVFYFGGRGPHLGESRSSPTDESIRLAGLAAFVLSQNVTFLAQAPVPVPVVITEDPQVPPLSVQVGNRAETTETVLDVNGIAKEQLAANMPWIIARAVMRRTTKAVAATVAGKAAGQGANNEMLGDMIAFLVTLFSTSMENADTRSWNTLPATIQALNMDLEAGEHTVVLNGSNKEYQVRISPGRNSYMFVIQPSLTALPAVVIDKYSRHLDEGQ